MQQFQSESINELVKALAEAQKEMKNAVKDSKNPHFRSDYASLASCIEASKSVLSSKGLAVVQTTLLEGNSLVLRTMLAHVSGQYVNSYYPVSPEKQTPQGFGSAMTYARRYSLLAILGMSQEDDDAELATNRDVTETAPTQKDTQRSPTENQLKRLYAITKASNWTTEEVKSHLNKLGLKEAKEMNWLQYEKLCETISKNPKMVMNEKKAPSIQ